MFPPNIDLASKICWLYVVSQSGRVTLFLPLSLLFFSFLRAGGFELLKLSAGSTLSSNLVRAASKFKNPLLHCLKCIFLIFINCLHSLDRVIQKKRRDYSDSSSTNNMKRLNEDLNNIQDIMRKTIDDLIDR